MELNPLYLVLGNCNTICTQCTKNSIHSLKISLRSKKLPMLFHNMEQSRWGRVAYTNYEVCVEDVAVEQGRLASESNVSVDGFLSFPLTFKNTKEMLDVLEALVQGSEWMREKQGSMISITRE